MENKRKIWVRVAAFMAAMICCVICVVPAYADETETKTVQGDLIAEQAEKIEGYISSLGYGDLTLTAGEQLEIGQRTYAEVQSYTWISSERVPLGYYPTVNTSINSVYNGGFTFIIRDQNGEVVLSRDWAVLYRVYLMADRDGMEFNFYQNSSGSGGRLYIEYDLTNSRWVRIGFSTTSSISTYYSIASGYSFEIQVWSPSARLNIGDYAGFLVINPSQLLSLNASASNEEVYNQGYAAGFQFGFEEGEMHGLEEGLDRGREEGYTEGDADGYRRGYDDGMHQTSLIEGIKSLFRAPMEFLESALNFEIFGIDLGDAVKAIVSMMLLALVVTIVWKAVK